MTQGQFQAIYDEIRAKGWDTFAHELEERVIARALWENDGSCIEAANTIKVKRTTLVMKRKRFGML